MIGDDFSRRLPEHYPNYHQWITYPNNGPTREELDALKREIQELKELLKAAKKYDEATGQRDCEMAQKIELLTKLASLVGVDLSDVFPAQAGEAGTAETEGLSPQGEHAVPKGCAQKARQMMRPNSNSQKACE